MRSRPHPLPGTHLTRFERRVRAEFVSALSLRSEGCQKTPWREKNPSRASSEFGIAHGRGSGFDQSFDPLQPLVHPIEATAELHELACDVEQALIGGEALLIEQRAIAFQLGDVAHDLIELGIDPSQVGERVILYVGHGSRVPVIYEFVACQSAARQLFQCFDPIIPPAIAQPHGAVIKPDH